jgi:MFS family permease
MKIFYGWKIVFAAASLQFIQSMMLHQAFGAYVAVLIQEKQWSKTSVSGASAMMSMEAAVIGPILGWFLDRFGSRGVIKVGVIVFGIGFMLMSQIDTLLGFYGAVVVIAIGSSMAGYFPLNVGVIQWFEKKRARALSMVGLGLALGGMFVPIVAWSIENIGWRETSFGCGVVAISPHSRSNSFECWRRFGRCCGRVVNCSTSPARFSPTRERRSSGVSSVVLPTASAFRFIGPGRMARSRRSPSFCRSPGRYASTMASFMPV